jgi:hypothetical protein
LTTRLRKNTEKWRRKLDAEEAARQAAAATATTSSMWDEDDLEL